MSTWTAATAPLIDRARGPPAPWRLVLALAGAAVTGLALGALLPWRATPASRPAARCASRPRRSTACRSRTRASCPTARPSSTAPRAARLPPDLFVINPSAEAPQPLDVPDAHLLSVSSKGELALIADATALEQRLYQRHAGAHDDRQLAARGARERARGRLGARRRRRWRSCTTSATDAIGSSTPSARHCTRSAAT